MSQLSSLGEDVQPLRDSVTCDVIAPGDPSYDEARKVWNGMVDKYPAAVVRCSSTAEVVAAVTFARDRELPLAVRCGAHSTPGYSSMRWRNRDRPAADERRAG